jgi:hypothetical protein
MVSLYFNFPMIAPNTKRKLFLILFISLSGLLVILFAIRNPILRYVANTKLTAIESSTGLNINYKTLSFCGVRSVCISGIRANNYDSLSVLDIGSVKIRLSFWDLLRLKVNPKFIEIDTIRIDVSAYKARNRADSFITNTVLYKHLLETRQFSRIIKGFLGVSTAEVRISNMLVVFRNPQYSFELHAPLFESKKGNFNSIIRIVEQGVEASVVLKGKGIKADDFISVSLSGVEKQRVIVPLIEYLFEVKCNFESLHFALKGNELAADSLSLSVTSAISGLEVENRHLSDKTVFVDNATLNVGFGLSDRFITLDSSSLFTLNTFKLPVSLVISNTKKPRFIAKSETGKFPASNLFESLPKGLFNNLQGIKVQGDMSFSLFADVDFANPDSLKFNVDLSPYNFKINAFGAENFYAINDTFTYVVFENGFALREIPIDNNYIGYTKLNTISTNLLNAVVTSEDGGFFFHKGFDFDGIRYAMVQNLTNKRFARGGSTITQQIVKNVYLNRSKNIMRKAEEALIVWLIETQRIATKERLLEIYFNIIEWGPNVYGPIEASKFYFDKLPSNLSLNESLFLTSIIPRPKSFTSSIDSLGNLTPFIWENHLRIARIMLERGTISQEEFDKLEPKLILCKQATEYIKSKGKVEEEIVEIDEEIFGEE